MADQRKQKTEKTPKGMTVPVPKRKDFFGNLKRIAGPEAKKAPTGKKDHDRAAKGDSD